VFLPANGIAFFDQARGDISLAPVELDMTVLYQLASLGTGISEAQTVDDIIQPSFQQCQQIISGNARLLFRQGKEAVELLFHHSVGIANFLLLSQLEPAVRDPAPSPVRQPPALFYGAFRGETTVTLKH